STRTPHRTAPYNPTSRTIPPRPTPSHRLSLLLARHLLFFFNATPPTEIYTLSLHDALPISMKAALDGWLERASFERLHDVLLPRSEEHTSELQSRGHLVCRLLLEKKKEKDGPNP